MDDPALQRDPMPRAGGFWRSSADLSRRLLDALFYTHEGRFARTLRWMWMLALLLAGAYLWGVFFSWGNLSFDFLDWAEVTGPRYALLRDAINKGQFPLHAENVTALRGITDRYFSIADTPFPPQVILLRFLSPEQYIFADTLLLYALGFVGLALLARRYRLAPLPFFALFMLFNFNGYITTHFAVGHSVWTGYFLLPFFVLLVFDLLERGSAGWRWVLGLGLLLLSVLLQGFFHLYLWCLIFLALLAAANLRLIRPIVLGGLFSVLLALPRLLPPSLALDGVRHEYLGGFTTLTDLVFNLFLMRDPDRAVQLPSKIMPLGWWELDFFIGIIGFALVVIFGVIMAARSARAGEAAGLTPSRAVVGPLFAASIVMSAFSVGQVYAWVLKILPFPPLTAERVTSRMFILPLVFLIVLAVIFLQRWLERRRISAAAQGLGLALSALLFHDLNQHLQAWRVRYLDGLVYLFKKVPFDAREHTIFNHPDPLYTGMLLGGLAIALLALGFLVVMSLRERGGSRVGR